MAHTLQDRYSSVLDKLLRANLVKSNGTVFNTTYEGTPKAGAVKIPVRDTEVAVAAYSKTTGATMTHGATSYLTVNIDKDYAVNELIDGYDAAAVPDNLVAQRIESAAYSLALQMEKDATAELLTSGTALAGTTALTKATVYDTIIDARTELSKANVPANGRFLLVSPEIYALLLKNDNFIHASVAGDAVIASGAVGKIAGFTVFEDNTLNSSVSTETKVDFVAGHPDWCCRVEEWQSPVTINDLKGSGTYIGASAVQGRKIYAHKVSKAACVIVRRHA